MSEKYKGKYKTKSMRLAGWDYRKPASYFITICTKNRKCFFGNIIREQQNQKMILSSIGQYADDYWLRIPKHFPHAEIDAFVVMPNHIHGIITIKKGFFYDKMENEMIENEMVDNAGIVACNDSTGDSTGDFTNDDSIGDSTNDDSSKDNSSNGDSTNILQTDDEDIWVNNIEKDFQKSQISPKPGSISTIIRSYKSAVSKETHEINPEFGWQSKFHDRVIRNIFVFGKVTDYINNNVNRWDVDNFYT